MTHSLQPWRATCTPHRDIREDAVSEALFAVNLSRAIALAGAEEQPQLADLLHLHVKWNHA